VSAHCSLLDNIKGYPENNFDHHFILMSRKTSAWICRAPGESLEKGEIVLPPLGPNDVEIKIIASGICASDLFLLNHPLPGFQFPLVAGHEGIGVVTEVGSGVKNLKPGDRAGVGAYRNCCKTCKYCLTGENQLCLQQVLTFTGGNSGTFGEYVRVDSLFAIPIPDALTDEDAAPMMCAGHTTFAPFRKHNVKFGDSVGIVGIGGLGHLAIQFARKLGCEVYVISTTPKKEEEARSLGAHFFVNSKDEAALAAIQAKLDFVMVTASGKNLPWSELFAALTPNGKLILMGGGHEAIPVTPLQLIMGEKSVVGSAVGSTATMHEMLKLCAHHNVKPILQTFSFDKINEAIEAVAKGDIRYRAVLHHATKEKSQL